MRLAVLLALLGSIPALSAGVIPKGSSVFFLDTQRGLPAWRLLVNFRAAKVPLHIVHRSEDAEYFLRVSYGRTVSVHLTVGLSRCLSRLRSLTLRMIRSFGRTLPAGNLGGSCIYRSAPLPMR